MKTLGFALVLFCSAIEIFSYSKVEFQFFCKNRRPFDVVLLTTFPHYVHLLLNYIVNTFLKIFNII